MEVSRFSAVSLGCVPTRRPIGLLVRGRANQSGDDHGRHQLQSGQRVASLACGGAAGIEIGWGSEQP